MPQTCPIHGHFGMESVPDPCYMMDMADSEIYYAVAKEIKKV